MSSVDADPKLTQVFYWLCLIFRQEKKGDHHGNVRGQMRLIAKP
jgi:hypothetical protein